MIVFVFIYKVVASILLIVLGCCSAYLSGKYTFKLFDYFLSIRDVVRMSQYDYDKAKFLKSASAGLIPVVIVVMCIYVVWNGDWETNEDKQDRIEQLVNDESKVKYDRSSVIKGLVNMYPDKDLPAEMSLIVRENVVRGTFKVGSKSGEMKTIEIPLTSGKVVNWEMYSHNTEDILATISGNFKLADDSGCKTIVGFDGYISILGNNNPYSEPLDIHLSINGNTESYGEESSSDVTSTSKLNENETKD